jgi:hypothetical protein
MIAISRTDYSNTLCGSAVAVPLLLSKSMTEARSKSTPKRNSVSNSRHSQAAFKASRLNSALSGGRFQLVSDAVLIPSSYISLLI